MRESDRWVGRRRPEAIGGLALFEAHRAGVVELEATAASHPPRLLRRPRRASSVLTRWCERDEWLEALEVLNWGRRRKRLQVARRLVALLRARFASCVSGIVTFDSWADSTVSRSTVQRAVKWLERHGYLRVTRFRLQKRPDPRYPANVYRLCLPVEVDQLALESAPKQGNDLVYSEATLKESGRDLEEGWTGLPAAVPEGHGHEIASRGQEAAPDWERMRAGARGMLARMKQRKGRT